MHANTPVLFEVRDRIAIITLNRPERRNAVDTALTDALSAAIERLETDADLSVGILRGNGPVFCAGMDLGAFLDGQAERILFGPGGFAGLAKRRRKKPLIAAVHGAALAGGFELMLACDLVVSSPECRFGLPETRLGLMAGGGGALRLAQSLPRAVADEILLLGDTFGAERAQALGLINRIVPAADLDSAALELAAGVAANAPAALAASLAMVDAVVRDVDGASWALSDVLLRTLITGEDAREGALAFTEKRKPVWSGR